MPMFTLDDVRRIMRSCAGVPDAVDLNSDIADVPFADMGYDSLAMLEMAAHVQQEFGIRIPDDAVEEMKTPQEAVDYVNRRFAGELQG
ncbi:MAG TPA: phosphopantetheine-binding protein [Thermopolyspora sp.]|jgi:Acyl carrier protein